MATRITNQKLSKSSRAWMREHLDDPFVKKAQKEGYRARAAYKLLEIQEKYKIIKPGMTVVDYCAGGGGKTLGLAQAMAGQGTLIASDVVNKRLENIRPRLQRAGVEAELVLIGQNGGGLEELNDCADLVFVDAPCSGSGTWRRTPDAKWRLTPQGFADLLDLQTAILAQAAGFVAALRFGSYPL